MIESPPQIDPIKSLTKLLAIHPTAINALLPVIEKANTSYQYWSKFKYIDLPAIDGVTHPLAWGYLKWQRMVNGRRLLLPSLGTLQYYPTDELQKILHDLDLRMGGTLGANDLFEQPHRKRFILNALMEEAIASSQLEGASTTRRVAKEMLRTKRAPTNLSERMIMNNYMAMLYVTETQLEELTPAALLQLHRKATNDTLENPSHEGAFRAGEVSVVDKISGEVAHEAPPAERLPELINDFCALANDSLDLPFIHPLAKASILHFLIGYIHPFEDGNGRTARVVMYWYMLRKGYWLTEFLVISKAIAKSRSAYDKAYLYTEHDELDVTYFVRYQLRAFQTACSDLDVYIEKTVKKQRELYNQQIQLAINQRQAELLRRIQQDNARVLTVADVAEEFSITPQTARTDLTDLVERGLLQKIHAGRKHLFVSEAYPRLLL